MLKIYIWLHFDIAYNIFHTLYIAFKCCTSSNFNTNIHHCLLSVVYVKFLTFAGRKFISQEWCKGFVINSVYPSSAKDEAFVYKLRCLSKWNAFQQITYLFIVHVVTDNIHDTNGVKIMRLCYRTFSTWYLVIVIVIVSRV